MVLDLRTQTLLSPPLCVLTIGFATGNLTKKLPPLKLCLSSGNVLSVFIRNICTFHVGNMNIAQLPNNMKDDN